MRITLSEENQLLVDAVSAFVARGYPQAKREAIVKAGGFSNEVWQSLNTDLGLLGLGYDERWEGVGGGLLEIVLVNRELGRGLVLEPYLEAVAYAGPLLRAATGVDAVSLGEAAATGKRLVVPALLEGADFRFSVNTAARKTGGAWQLKGKKTIAVGGAQADTLLVSARDAETGETLVVAVDPKAHGVSRESFQLVDGRSAADISFAGTVVGENSILLRGTEADAAIATATAEATIALAGVAVGVLEELLSATVDYTKQRRQFGAQISTFQALQHRMVDMHLEVEKLRAAVFAAASAWPETWPERRRLASLVKVQLAKASKFVGENAIQLHGGIGTTEELFVSHHFRRSVILVSEFGTDKDHLKILAEGQRAAA